MSSSRFCTLLVAVSGFLLLSLSELAEAQLVRRFARGGIQVNAPFVRVNVRAGGRTSVRAPFVAIDRPGRTYVGRRGRLLAQPQYAAPHSPGIVQKTPETADVDALPYPTASELAAMEDDVLVETLRQMMARLHYRLSRLKTGEGWQKYLVLSREILGSPGAPPEAAQFDAVQKVLPRYHSVQDNPLFTKISGLPSFAATLAALQETDRRFGGSVSNGPEINDPEESNEPSPIESSTEEPPKEMHEEPLEILPTPQATVVPNATRGERSILKRK